MAISDRRSCAVETSISTEARLLSGRSEVLRQRREYRLCPATAPRCPGSVRQLAAKWPGDDCSTARRAKPCRPGEGFTTCSTAAASFLTFHAGGRLAPDARRWCARAPAATRTRCRARLRRSTAPTPFTCTPARIPITSPCRIRAQAAGMRQFYLFARTCLVVRNVVATIMVRRAD